MKEYQNHFGFVFHETITALAFIIIYVYLAIKYCHLLCKSIHTSKIEIKIVLWLL